MCKTRHIHKTTSEKRIIEYLNSLSPEKIKELRTQIMRLISRGGLALVLDQEMKSALTVYDLNSYRRS